jgi:uncharacterized protein YifE (UPF0438 family)
MATFNCRLKKQVNRRDHVGDLVGDIVHDHCLPASKEGWHKMLAVHTACDEAVAAFEQAWSEYAALKTRHARRVGGANKAVDEVSDAFVCNCTDLSNWCYPLIPCVGWCRTLISQACVLP